MYYIIAILTTFYFRFILNSNLEEGEKIKEEENAGINPDAATPLPKTDMENKVAENEVANTKPFPILNTEPKESSTDEIAKDVINPDRKVKEKNTAITKKILEQQIIKPGGKPFEILIENKSNDKVSDTEKDKEKQDVGGKNNGQNDVVNGIKAPDNNEPNSNVKNDDSDKPVLKEEKRIENKDKDKDMVDVNQNNVKDENEKKDDLKENNEDGSLKPSNNTKTGKTSDSKPANNSNSSLKRFSADKNIKYSCKLKEKNNNICVNKEINGENVEALFDNEQVEEILLPHVGNFFITAIFGKKEAGKDIFHLKNIDWHMEANTSLFISYDSDGNLLIKGTKNNFTKTLFDRKINTVSGDKLAMNLSNTIKKI